MLHSAKKAQLWHSIWESLECKMMTDVFLCKWIFNSDPDVITFVGQEKICFHFIQGWSRVTSFETLLTSCDSQIIRLLGFTIYSMRNGKVVSCNAELPFCSAVQTFNPSPNSIKTFQLENFTFNNSATCKHCYNNVRNTAKANALFRGTKYKSTR